MNFKISLQHAFQQFIGGLVILMAGAIGVTTANSVMAQSASDLPAQTAQASSLTGSWRLLNMTAPGSPMPMLPAASSVPTAEFAGDRVFGTGGCNRFMGGFEAAGEQLSVEPLASTFMACEDGVMAQETLYLTALQAAQRYEIDDGFLAIFYATDQGSGVLRFAAQPDEAPASSRPSEPVQALW